MILIIHLFFVVSHIEMKHLHVIAKPINISTQWENVVRGSHPLQCCVWFPPMSWPDASRVPSASRVAATTGCLMALWDSGRWTQSNMHLLMGHWQQQLFPYQPGLPTQQLHSEGQVPLQAHSPPPRPLFLSSLLAMPQLPPPAMVDPEVWGDHQIPPRHLPGLHTCEYQ